MFGKKKQKTEEAFTPADLARLTEENRKKYGRITAQRAARELTTSEKWKRRSFWTLLALLVILLVMYLISTLLTQWGDLVISVDGSAQDKGIVVGEKADLSDGTVQLGAPQVKDVTNITYEWLPFDELDTKEGSYNGANHLAYTFFVGNNGKQAVEYDGVLSISGVSKGMDEAIRIMVYKNGEPTIYAKKNRDGSALEEGTVTFVDDTVIMNVGMSQVEPGKTDRYTIVSWVEGNDPECVDDIMGGYLRMAMLFNIADDEE